MSRDTKKSKPAGVMKQFWDAFKNTAESIEEIAERAKSDERFKAKAEALLNALTDLKRTTKTLEEQPQDLASAESTSDRQRYLIQNQLLGQRNALKNATTDLVESMTQAGALRESHKKRQSQEEPIKYKDLSTMARKLGRLSRQLSQLLIAIAGFGKASTVGLLGGKEDIVTFPRLLVTNPKKAFSKEGFRAWLEHTPRQLKTAVLKGAKLFKGGKYDRNI